MHGVLVLGLFAGAVALAAYINDWQELKEFNDSLSEFINIRKEEISLALDDVINFSLATAVSLPLRV